MVKKKYKNNKGQKISAGKLYNQIFKFFASHTNKMYSPKQVGSKLKVANSKDSLKHAFDRLADEKIIQHIKDGKYGWTGNFDDKVRDNARNTGLKTRKGTVDLTRSGAGYIVIEGMEQDVYVPAKYMNTAMHRDIVQVAVSTPRGRRKPEGRVLAIEKRSLTNVIGTLRIFDKYAVVFPEIEAGFPDVHINLKNVEEASDGQRVLADIIEWGHSQNKAIWGKVSHVLKDANQNDIAMQSILISNGFNLHFPEAVIEESEAISGAITDEELEVRRDMRETLTFTIDPATARDFDDAISYKELDEGKVEIGVHIADVTHFLRENSALDREAFERSTSVYLVDRVLPMLPERLSNDLCSLNPDEDKYTFSAVFTFDRKYNIIDRWFGKTVIHSSRRFTYEEAQERLESGEGDLADELRKVNEVAHKLRKDKFTKGAINFESDEIRFELDEENKPISVYIKERKDAHKLVEDFMLLANKEVAMYVYKKATPEVPAIYRIHDAPDMERLADFALFAKAMGYQMNLDTPTNIINSFNNLTKAAEEDEALKMLAPLAIRTMSKAVYSTENIGHYGLGFEYYTHFTSPIRRYSDVLVHRVLFENLKEVNKRDGEILEAKAKHISRQERKATDAERESIKYKQVEYMLDKEGQEFIGVVSGMIDRGFFVEVTDSKAEGLVSFHQTPEPYKISESRLYATSRSGHTLAIGSQVRVRLEEVDLYNKQLEFTLLELMGTEEK